MNEAASVSGRDSMRVINHCVWLSVVCNLSRARSLSLSIYLSLVSALLCSLALLQLFIDDGLWRGGEQPPHSALPHNRFDRPRFPPLLLSDSHAV